MSDVGGVQRGRITQTGTTSSQTNVKVTAGIRIIAVRSNSTQSLSIARSTSRTAIDEVDAKEIADRMTILHNEYSQDPSQPNKNHIRAEFHRIHRQEVLTRDFNVSAKTRAVRRSITQLILSMMAENKEPIAKGKQEEFDILYHQISYGDDSADKPLQSPPPASAHPDQQPDGEKIFDVIVVTASDNDVKDNVKDNLKDSAKDNLKTDTSATSIIHVLSSRRAALLGMAGLSDIQIKKLSDIQMQSKINTLKELLEKNIGSNNQVARAAYDEALDYMISHYYQTNLDLPNALAELMINMETKLILHGLYLDKAIVSLVPILDDSEIKALPEIQLTNLLHHLFTMVSEYLYVEPDQQVVNAKVQMAKNVYAEIVKYLSIKYPNGSDTAPAATVLLFNQMHLIAANCGVDLDA